ncbi:hypothetical protein SBC1_09160 [Caballeronia sp. SBC1]|nr:hypothetical protein SBC2_10550 [Caballeronia sp. SBC2]QIN60934.1 hypothetical protein SBC1_09160 [Caballeronia sp. SBC1]
MMAAADFGNKARKRLRFDNNGYRLSKYFLLRDMVGLIRNYYDRLFSFLPLRFEHQPSKLLPRVQPGLVAGNGLEPSALECT